MNLKKEKKKKKKRQKNEIRNETRGWKTRERGRRKKGKISKGHNYQK